MKSKSALLGLIVVSFASAVSNAATIYWDGANGSWLNNAAWSSDSAATTPDPAAAPAAGDDAVFNISSANAATTVTFNAAHAANSLTFNNTGTTTLAADGTNRALSVGAGGMTMAAGAGTATIGSATANQNIPVTFTASQTWNNNSSNPIVLANVFSCSAGVNVVKQGSGTVWASNTGASTITGNLTIDGGKIQTSGDLTWNGVLSGSGTLENGGPNSKWVFQLGAGDSTFSGSITGTATARLGLNKRNGTGTLTLSGNNVLGDRLAVDRGTILITGTTVAGVSGTTSGPVITGNAANQNGILWVNGGTLTAYKNNSPSVAIGNVANSSGLLKLTSGTITTTSEFHIGRGTGAYAAFTQTGGTATSGSWLAVGLNNDRAVLNQSGGSFTVNANRMTIGAGGAGSIGVANHSGGTFTSNAGLFIGENGTGTLNISGTHSMTLGTGGTAQFAGNAVSLAGTVNLLGGTLAVNSVTKGASTATGVYRFNFNGGTLKANASTTTFFNDLALTDAYVYQGGGSVDNSGFNITLTEALRAPTGNGVSATGLTVSGGGYIDTPLVTITGGGGTGATAVATIDASGNLTGITITNPGIGYTSAPTFALAGGGSGNTGAISGTATLVPNNSGAVVFKGTGTTTLKSAFTYTGGTTVNAGKLDLNATFTSSAGAITIADGAALAVTPTAKGNIINTTNLTLGTSGATTYFANVGDLGNPTLGNPAFAPLNVTGNLAVNSTVTVNVTGTKFSVGTLKLLSYNTKSGSGSFVLGTLPAGVVATLQDDNAGSVHLNITQVALPRWDGTVDANWDTTTTNWIDQVLGTGSLYADPNPVLFDDTAAGVGGTSVVLNSTVAPKEVTYNNTSKAYSLTGTGKITGTATLTKKGTGALSITGIANDYTGVTRLEAGTTTVDSLTDGGVPSPLGAASATASNLVLAGGTLAYTGPSTAINRGIMLDATNSTINLTNNLTLSGGITSGLVGNLFKTGTGTLSITNTGTNTIGAGASGLMVTAGKVVFDGTAGTQINNIPVDMFVSHTPDVPADLTITASTVNVAAWLAVSRGSGDNGVCNLTLTNAVLNTGNFSCGYNNGLANNASETFITQDSSVFTNAGTTHLAENTGSTASWQLINGSVYTAGNTLNVGGAGTGTAVVTVKDTSSIVKGGAGTLAIGNSGIGTINLEGSSLLNVPTVETYIGNAGLTTEGYLNIKDSATANFGATVFVGKSNTDGTGTSKGTLTQTGGTVNAATWLVVGRYVGAQGTYDISAGTTNQTGTGNAMIVGEAGTGVLNVSGTGTVNVLGNLLSIGKVATGVGTVNLNGGTIVAKRVAEEAGGGSSTFNFNGGVLRASAASTDFVAVDTATIQTGGAFIDSNGFDLTIARTLGGTGGLTKQGAGTLLLTADPSYTGATTVNGGTLALGGANQLPTTTTLNVNAGAMDVRNGSASRLLNIADLNLTGGTLLVGMSGTGTDTVNASGTVTGTGTNTIKLFGSIDNGTYDLITSVGGVSGTIQLDTSALAAGFTTYSGAISGTKYVLTVSGAATPADAYWLGDVGSVWNTAGASQNSNWATTAAGTTDTNQIPGPTTDVYFQASGAANTSTTLGADFAIDSLTFIGGVSTIGGANQLSIGGTNPNFVTLEVQSGATANIALSNLSYSGDTLVAAGGTLNVSGGSLGSTTDGNLQVDATGTVNVDSFFGKGSLSGAGTVSRSVSGTGILTIGGSMDTEFSGLIQDGSGIVRINRAGTGKLTLSGANTHTGGTSLSGGILELANADAAGPGTLTLSGGTLDNATGSALNLTNAVTLGGAWTFTGTNDLTLSGSLTSVSQPTVTISGGTLSLPGTVSGQYGLVKNGGGTLVLSGSVTSAATNGAGVISLAAGTTQFSGTLQSTGAEIWLGNAAGNSAMVNMASGTINAVNWLAIGRDSANGTFNMSGGTVTKTTATGNITTAGVGGAQTATINQSGGTITNTASATWIGEHGTGIYNLSGSSVANLGVLNLGVVDVATANGTVNLNGGSLSVTQILKGGASAQGTFNFNGGTLTANTGAVAATFMNGLTAANVRNGGAIINTNGQDITIAQALQHSVIGGDAAKDGGLAKNGTGKLTLTGSCSYTGDTTVNAGVLSLTYATLDDASGVTIASGATLDLTHTQTDIVTSLTIGGVAMPGGVYGRIGSGAPHETAAITGDGKLQVGADPYESWADLKGLTGADRLSGADPDLDGLSNLAEYYLDGNPKAFTGMPPVTDNGTTVSITFSRRDDAEADIAAQILQISTNLGSWTDVAIPAASDTVGAVTFVVVENGSDSDTVTATVAKGTDPAKFLRIKVTE